MEPGIANEFFSVPRCVGRMRGFVEEKNINTEEGKKMENKKRNTTFSLSVTKRFCPKHSNLPRLTQKGIVIGNGRRRREKNNNHYMETGLFAERICYLKLIQEK